MGRTGLLTNRLLGSAQDASPDETGIRDKLIVALDFPSQNDALDLVHNLGDTVSIYKVGMELAYNPEAGFTFIRELINEHNKDVFLDLKILDIPTTVSRAVKQLCNLGVRFLTIHSDRPAVKAAVEARNDADEQRPTKIFCVTVLTSIDELEWRELGWNKSIEETVGIRTRHAIENGADGVICSGHEIEAARSAANLISQNRNGILIATPGIRLEDDDNYDQKRVMLPEDAIRKGADHIIVGRPITQDRDPRMKAKAILDRIASALPAREAGLAIKSLDKRAEPQPRGAGLRLSV